MSCQAFIRHDRIKLAMQNRSAIFKGVFARERSVVFASLAVCLLTALSGCAAEEHTDIDYDPDLNHRFSERCQSQEEGTRGDLSGVFNVKWDSITFAAPGSSYAEIARQSGARWSEDFRGKTTFEEFIVVSMDGVAVQAYQAEGYPFRLVPENGHVLTVPFPGRFTAERNGCSFYVSPN